MKYCENFTRWGIARGRRAERSPPSFRAIGFADAQDINHEAMPASAGIAVKFLVIFLIGGLIISGTYAALGLFADGSYDLINILTHGWDLTYARAFVELITQSLDILAIKMGIRDLNFLVRLYSFALIGLPLGVWIAALLLQLKTDLFWLFVIAFSVTFLSSGFCIIGEYNLTYALTAFSASILLRKDRMGPISGIALMASAFILLSSYEAMIFLGPVLFSMAILRLLLTKQEDTLLSKLMVIAASFLFAASFGVAFMSLLFPRDAANMAGAARIKPIVHSMHFIYLSFMAVLFFMVLLVKKPMIKKGIIGLAFLASAVYLMDKNFWNAPVMYYAFRAFSGFLLFELILFMVLEFFYRKNDLVSVGIDKISLFIFIAFLIPFYSHILGFYHWAKTFEQTVLTHRGMITLEESPLMSKAHAPYNWIWATPSASVIFRGNQPGAIIHQSNYSGWQPFDPNTIDPNILGSFKKTSSLYCLFS